jgi:hypothetical protein
VIYKGDIIKKEDTYLKRMVLPQDPFLLLAGSLQAKKWQRFLRLEKSDYFYMSESYWDAVQFKPKIDIYFLGFAMMN